MPKLVRHSSIQSHSYSWRAIITLLLLMGALALLYGHRSIFSTSLMAARHASSGWLILVVILAASTFFVASGTYKVLAFHRLRYSETLNVELATAFVNRLLPAGLGGLGLLGRYLYKRRHTVPEATVIVSVNNLLGIIAHLLLIGMAALLYPDAFKQFKAGHIRVLNAKIIVILIVLLIFIIAIKPVRLQIKKLIDTILRSLSKLHLQQILCGLLLSMLLTTLYTLVLFCSAKSLGLQLGVIQIFIAFSASVLVSAVTPTPGGLVGAEAGLLAALVAFGTTTTTAGAVVVIYRTATYWLPLLPGYIALLFARRRNLV